MRRVLHIIGVAGVALSCGVCGAYAEDTLWQDSHKVASPVEINLPSFAPIIEKLSPSVVNISIEGKEEVQNPFGGDGLRGEHDPNEPVNPFEFFFQVPQDQLGKRPFEGLGSGFVINADGYIITNNHVVDKATKITVKFKDDEEEYAAKVVGRDSKTDIALLKVDGAKNLTPVVLGDSDQVQPGDWVIAIGNPFNLGHTATVGIVSAKSRRNVGGPYNDFIQTDASINPGNSGGPLFNAHGQVVGINTAIFSPGRFGNSGFNIGIGFATPINIVKEVLEQLHTKGKVTRGWLGVLIQQVTPDAAKALGLQSAKGALVADVSKDSPADKAGIKRGDIIIAFDSQKIEENNQLPAIVGRTEIGKSVNVTVLRENKEKVFKVKIEELKDEDQEKVSSSESQENKLGLTVQEVTPDLAKSLGLDDALGVVVTYVAPDGAAARSGLQRGDVILEVGSKVVNTIKEFQAQTKGLDKDKPLLMLVRRGEHTIFLTIKIED